MKPILFHIFSLPVYSYSLAASLGGVLMISLIELEARRLSLERPRIYPLLFCMLLSGLVGARLLHAVLHREPFLENPVSLLFFWRGGMTFYGLLLFSVPVFLWYVHRYRLDGWKVADAFAPGFALFMAVMRLGCFLTGCCYGRTCSSAFPLAVVYPEQIGQLPVGIPLHPVQLYASGSALLAFCILWNWRRRQTFAGQLVLFLMIYYPVSRFLLGFFRGDERAIISLAGVDLSIFQILGLPVSMAAVWLYTRRSAHDPSRVVEKNPSF